MTVRPKKAQLTADNLIGCLRLSLENNFVSFQTDPLIHPRPFLVHVNDAVVRDDLNTEITQEEIRCLHFDENVLSATIRVRNPLRLLLQAVLTAFISCAGGRKFSMEGF